MKKEFTMYEKAPIHDSMCYDSGTQICSYGTDKEYVSVVVRGYVKVFYKDDCYRHFSEMPEEIQKIMLKGQWAKFEQLCTIAENNWHEIEYFRDGEYIGGDVFEIGTPTTEKELKELCEEVLEEYHKEYEYDI